MSSHDADDLKPGKGVTAQPEAVGYRNPPKATRFKKGHSGNPKGRPKGSVSLRQHIRKELNKKITVNIGGKHRTVTKREAMAMTTVASGLKGDPRALATILQVEALYERTEEKPDPNAPIRDDEVVAALKRRIERAVRQSARNDKTEEDKTGRDEDDTGGSRE